MHRTITNENISFGMFPTVHFVTICFNFKHSSLHEPITHPVASCLQTFHSVLTSPTLLSSSVRNDTKRRSDFLFTKQFFCEWVHDTAYSSIGSHLLGNQPIDRHCMHLLTAHIRHQYIYILLCYS